MKAIVEMTKGSKYKYEIDKAWGGLKLDRPLLIRVPHNYGYIPDTLAPDGDALDIFILSEDPIPPLAHVEVEILGGYVCEDQGVRDEKIVAKIKGDTYPTMCSEIVHYLGLYKEGFEVLSWMDVTEAKRLIERYTIGRRGD